MPMQKVPVRKTPKISKFIGGCLQKWYASESQEILRTPSSIFPPVISLQAIQESAVMRKIDSFYGNMTFRLINQSQGPCTLQQRQD